MLKTSTGLRNSILTVNSLANLLGGGVINVYAGTAPASANDALVAENVLLVTISANGTGGGLTFAATAEGGLLQKDAAQLWKGTVVANGTASFYRHVAAGDSANQSATAVRVQGDIGVFGKELNLANVNMVAGANQNVDYYVVGIPTV